MYINLYKFIHKYICIYIYIYVYIYIKPHSPLCIISVACAAAIAHLNPNLLMLIK